MLFTIFAPLILAVGFTVALIVRQSASPHKSRSPNVSDIHSENFLTFAEDDSYSVSDWRGWSLRQKRSFCGEYLGKRITETTSDQLLDAMEQTFQEKTFENGTLQAWAKLMLGKIDGPFARWNGSEPKLQSSEPMHIHGKGTGQLVHFMSKILCTLNRRSRASEARLSPRTS